MLGSPRAPIAAIALATLWIVFDPASAAAECFPRVPDGTPLSADFAFSATVTSVSTDPDEMALAAGEGNGSTWRVELLVERVHVGDVRGGPLVWTGHTLRHLSCNNDLLGERLRVGERLFIAIERQFGSMTSPQPYGRLLAWQRIGEGWKFYEAALADDADPDAGPYPRSAREASTTQEILDAISGHVPDTATAATSGHDEPLTAWTGRAVLLAVAFAITFLAASSAFVARDRISRAGDMTHS